MQRIRLSERLLWFAFNFLVENRITESYVDVFPTHPALIAFFELFGFHEIGKTRRGECRLFKSTQAGSQPEPSRFRAVFPSYDDSPPLFLVIG